MLYVYGPLLPLRILEEIRFWKQQESEHTDVIKAIVPNLEPVYVQLLDQWKVLFEETEQAAQRLLNQVLPGTHQADPYVLAQLEQLLDVSCRQSREFIRQLYQLIEKSSAVKTVPLAPVVLLHIIRESEYFLGVLETLSKPGSIAESVQHPPMLDPHEPQPFRISEPSVRQDEPSAGASQANTSALTGQPQAQQDRPVPIGGHTLPPLPYPYNALEPYIDEKTMRIHHDIHHKSYVDGLNKAEKKLEEARRKNDFELVKHWERELAFNGAGHYLHTIFWTIMSPQGGGRPTGALANQITKDFGSFEAFKKHFSEAAEKVEGGGWAILVWSPRAQRLEILQAEKHQNLSQWDVIPLLTLDVWEHAYYLKHQSNRKKYIEDWWNVVNWPAAAERYEQAHKLKWEPF
ncbi:Fe-Mn family superoxide dismutase [Paenibacillus sp. JX-17]|uniref:superoxide dismutase n=1 Tax=Paenibacillus lacisoli TaxID=3064525 RepID=A0ABT9CG55_9BACL|nr:Fe-Mn family superoxide dismutase [Paenibacillus sp. JX-17]MDO7908255.1 Fe-Mn family superoxide dismutase [Paenibacillus sp. JX-17]